METRLSVKILAVADQVVELLCGPGVGQRFGDVDLVVSCGDLPYDYLEYLVTLLNVPVFFVRGNHDARWKHGLEGQVPVCPQGCQDLHQRVVRHRGLLLAGLEGSHRYKPGPFQYTDWEMGWNVAGLWPALLWNRLRWGRYLDVLVTHAPPRGVHDQPDACHQGFQSLVRFMEWFRPRYLIHGHIHLYGSHQPWRTVYRDTEVVNAYGYRVIELTVPAKRKVSL